MIKHQQILHAKAALELGSFKKAAHAHNISEPAFSRSIANLEESLGVKLFSRNPTGSTATVYGQALEKYGEKILIAVSELEREIRLIQGLEKGELSVALAPYPSEISGHAAFANLISEFPGLRCKITVSDWFDVEEQVMSRRADLGIAELSEAIKNKHLIVEPLDRHNFVFYCRSDHPILKKHKVSKDNFNQYPFVGIKLPARLSSIFPGRSFPVRGTEYAVPSIEIQDTVLSREIVASSDALSACTPYQIRKELSGGLFSIIPIYESWMKLNYGFMYVKERTLSPAAEKYISLVRKVEEKVSLQNEEIMKRYFA